MDFRNEAVVFRASEAGFEDFYPEGAEVLFLVPSCSAPVSLSPSLQRVHQSALDAAQRFRKSEALLLDALTEVERERVFEKLGYASLFQYSVRELKLSESVAYSAITVARKAREVPSLRDGIHDGSISVAKAAKVVSVLNVANQEDWIPKLKSLPSRQLEKEVARVNPKSATPERATYVSEKRLALSLGVDEATLLEFRQAQDRVSRSRGRAVSLEETLAELLRFYLGRKDPVRVAKRVTAKKGSGLESMELTPESEPEPHSTESRFFDAQVPATKDSPENRASQLLLFTGRVPQTRSTPGFRRAPVPAAVAHRVNLRDEGRCQARLPDGTQCGERRWTDLHHRKSVAQGGLNTFENLVTLCRTHHKQEHR